MTKKRCIYVFAGMILLVTLFPLRTALNTDFLQPTWQPPNATVQLYPIRVRGKWGYIDQTGREVIPPRYRWAGEFTNGRASVAYPVSLLGPAVLGVIDVSGRALTARNISVECVKNTDPLPARPVTNLGLFSIVSKKYGVIDEMGRWLIEAKFYYIGPFCEGLAVATMDRGGNSLYGYLNLDGSWKIQPQYTSATDFVGEYAIVRQKNRSWGILNRAGQLIPLPGDVGYAWSISDGLVAAQLTTGLSGFLGLDGKWRIEPTFEWTPWHPDYGFQEGLARIREYQCIGFINKAGDWEIPAKYIWASPFSSGLAATIEMGESQIGYIDQSGATVIRPQFESAGDFKGELAPIDILLEGHADIEIPGGYIDRSGRIVWHQ